MSIIRAYLDIETTGCSRTHHALTVIGVAVEKEDIITPFQLVGPQISDLALSDILVDVNILYTYNGRRFDLPFIKHSLGLDLERQFKHRDLMYDCWRHKLKGGLKAVEVKLGIARQSKGIDGWMAVKLWWDYINNNDLSALQTLLIYNREDVVNLQTLRLKLGVE
ncbi:MAG: ribonuclease H-like domain-containing protein [Anaerohalosphaeraceae bacterium]